MSPSMSPFKLESGPAAPGVRAGRGGWCRAARAAARPRSDRCRLESCIGSAERFAVAHLSLYLSLSFLTYEHMTRAPHLS